MCVPDEWKISYISLLSILYMQYVNKCTILLFYYRIFRPIARALSIQKRSEIVNNERARYTLERFPTDNARVICTKKGIGKYGIMY
jgi:hypothetical protein